MLAYLYFRILRIAFHIDGQLFVSHIFMLGRDRLYICLISAPRSFVSVYVQYGESRRYDFCISLGPPIRCCFIPLFCILFPHIVYLKYFPICLFSPISSSLTCILPYSTPILCYCHLFNMHTSFFSFYISPSLMLCMGE